MTYRAAVILIEKGRIALVERYRQGTHYFTFPGGHVEADETPEQAAIRETEEELGLQVVIRRPVAEIWWHGKPQFYYLVDPVGGAFGTGTGAELSHPPPEKGTYTPVWLPLQELLTQPVLPQELTRIILEAQTAGWPDPPIVIHDQE